MHHLVLFLVLAIQCFCGNVRIERGSDVLLVDYHIKESDRVEFKLRLNRQAWFAFGPSPSASMEGADVALVLPDELRVSDAWIEGWSFDSIKTDEHQHFLNTRVEQGQDFTEAWFTRKLNTGDKQQDHALVNGKNTFVFAIGKSNSLDYHQHRGSVRLELNFAAENENEL
jgi:hypothetical protein